MMQAAKSRHGNDPATCILIFFYVAVGRSSLRRRQMRPVLMVVANILVHEAFQMTLIEYDHVVEQIFSTVEIGRAHV